MIVCLVTKFSSPIMRQRWLADFWRKNLFCRVSLLTARAVSKFWKIGEKCAPGPKKYEDWRCQELVPAIFKSPVANLYLWPFGGIFTGSEIEAHRQRRKSGIHRWHLCTVDHKSGVKVHFALFTFLIRTLAANGLANRFLPNLDNMFPYNWDVFCKISSSN